MIVGAGPAGIRAAEALVGAGLHPVVVDEGERAGGQIHRRPPEGLTRPPAVLYGSEAGGRRRALHRLDGMAAEGRLTYRGADQRRCPGRRVAAARAGGPGRGGPTGWSWRRRGRATGCCRCRGGRRWGLHCSGRRRSRLARRGHMGRRIVLAGSGPLLTLVARQPAGGGRRGGGGARYGAARGAGRRVARDGRPAGADGGGGWAMRLRSGRGIMPG
ncbi:MAG: NAD(P)-binding protein [Amaricoccus sp.]